jgi:hypothetical protein
MAYFQIYIYKSHQEIRSYARKFHAKDTNSQIFYYKVLMHSFILFGSIVWTDLALFRLFYFDFVLILYISGV